MRKIKSRKLSLSRYIKRIELKRNELQILVKHCQIKFAETSDVYFLQMGYIFHREEREVFRDYETLILKTYAEKPTDEEILALAIRKKLLEVDLKKKS